ncbi:MAG: hypothetical protein SFZ24_11900 [Planctomycetota bacterium]|nr:hypothetical protein [Planctomycetota bacterium]
MQKRVAIARALAGVLVSSTVLAAAENQAAPPTAPELMTTAVQWSADDLSVLAHWIEADQYSVFPGWIGPLTLISGNALLTMGAGYGDPVDVGATVSRGVFWNFSREPAELLVEQSGHIIVVPGSSFIVVGDIVKDVEEWMWPVASNRLANQHKPRPDMAAVSCGAGYYACCKYNQGGTTMTATCYRVGGPESPNCDAGGEGATQASVE